MKLYVSPGSCAAEMHHLMAKLQATGQASFNSCAADNGGCPTLRFDFGSLEAPPNDYQLKLDCSTSGVSTIPLTSCILTHVTGDIYDINCCAPSGPCCPCAGDNVLLADSEAINAGCCPCGPPPMLNPAFLGGCSGTAEVILLDESGAPVSSTVTSSDCPSLQAN